MSIPLPLRPRPRGPNAATLCVAVFTWAGSHVVRSAEPQPFLGLYLDAPAIRAEIDKRVPPEGKTPKYHMANGMIMSLGINRAFVFLYPGGEHFVYPVVMLQTANSAAVESFLTGEGPLAASVEKVGDGLYQLKPQPAEAPAAFPEGDAPAPAPGEGQESPKSPIPPEMFRIKVLPKGAIVAPIPLFEQWAQGGAKPMQTPAMKTIMTLIRKEDLGALALHIPENVSETWQKSVMEHEAIKELPEDPGTAMAVGMAGGVASQVLGPFETIESLGISFRFKGETGRRIRYTQMFREGADAAAIHKRLSSGEGSDKPAEGMVDKIAAALQNEHLTTATSLDGNRLTLSIDWDGANDQAIAGQLQQATMGGMGPPSPMPDQPLPE